MSMVKEFKQFIIRGNVVDMAVGIIIGVAFGKIVSSFVQDILMPPIGLVLGNMDFSDLSLVLREAADGKEAVTWNYGAFITAIVDFLIVAAAIFLVIKGINSFRKKEAETPSVPPAPTREEVLLTDIRDILKSRN
jgi:large conductance mechanosensitive channel